MRPDMTTQSLKQPRRLFPAVKLVILSTLVTVAGASAQTVSFNAPSDLAVGDTPESVVVGDFNGDGVQDLATANIASNNVSVLLGNGNGTFQAAVNFPTATAPRSVAVGDFNGDGVQDLAVANTVSNNVSVLLGNGDGTFQTARNFGADYNPLSV